MNRQIDWQAQQISHLVCSLAGQRCSEACGTFSTRTSQSITALIPWRKEEWRKEAADIPPSKVENDLCSTRQILALFWGQPWGDCWEMGRSAYWPFRALRCHLELKLKCDCPVLSVTLWLSGVVSYIVIVRCCQLHRDCPVTSWLSCYITIVRLQRDCLVTSWLSGVVGYTVITRCSLSTTVQSQTHRGCQCGHSPVGIVYCQSP